jgi:hypothetical protein
MIDAPPLVEPEKKTGRVSRWDYAGHRGGAPSVVHTKNVGLLLYARAFMWFHKIAEFRGAEIQLLYKKNPGKAVRAQHREILGGLIREGKGIVRRVHDGDRFIKPANGFSLQDVQSAVEELENTQLQWSGGMSKSRKAEILKDIFDAAQ